MYLYWRVQQDLSEIGNQLILHHPNLIRAYKNWYKKNKGGLKLVEDISWKDLHNMCVNPN